MGGSAFVEICALLRERLKPTAAYIISRDAKLVATLQSALDGLNLIVPVRVEAPGGELLALSLRRSGVRVHSIEEELDPDLGILPQARSLLMSAHASRLISASDRVLFAISAGIQSWGFFEGRDLRRSRLEELLGSRVRMDVLEAVLDLATELLREGREGYPAGALFIIGDPARVMPATREGIANPFEGHPQKYRSVGDRRNWRTIKNFAALDGACVVSPEGSVVAAGRYVNVSEHWTAFIQGTGGRHSAAVVATLAAGAVAVCASQEGIITVFNEGKPIYTVSVR